MAQLVARQSNLFLEAQQTITASDHDSTQTAAVRAIRNPQLVEAVARRTRRRSSPVTESLLTTRHRLSSRPMVPRWRHGFRSSSTATEPSTPTLQTAAWKIYSR